jgi:hypothetical protein
MSLFYLVVYSLFFFLECAASDSGSWFPSVLFKHIAPFNISGLNELTMQRVVTTITKVRKTTRENKTERETVQIQHTRRKNEGSLLAFFSVDKRQF